MGEKLINTCLHFQKSDHGYNKKKYTVVQNTKHFDCPAQIHMKEVVYFPEFKVREKNLLQNLMKYILILKHVRGLKRVEPKLLVYSREFLGITSVIRFRVSIKYSNRWN